MKRLLTLLVMMMTFSATSQHVAQKVQELKNQKSRFVPISVLSPSATISDTEVKKAVQHATLAKLDKAKVNEVVRNAYETIALEIPFKGSTLIVDLYKVSIYHPNFHLDTDKQSNVSFEAGAHYRGIIRDEANSIVSMNFFRGEMNGIVSSTPLNNVVIGKLDKPGNTEDYIVYSDADLLVANQSGCEVPEPDQDFRQMRQASSQLETNAVANANRCVTMYFEMDYQLYLSNQSNVTTTNNWMSSVFNNVQTLFANAGISTSLKNVFVWTSLDPYSGNSSSIYLNKFKELRPVFDGDVGHLIGIDAGMLGGVASSVAGVCGTASQCYSDVDPGYNTVPTYSWTVQVITHEIGHLLGSAHTHSCVWNGNNTPIDNCGPKAVPNSEGTSCMSTPPIIPTSTQKGSIMSYCHLIATVGISFNNGFGTQPTQRMIQTINGATCLSNDCVNTCINTAINMRADETTPTSALLAWDDIGTVGNWQGSISTIVGTANYTNYTGNSYLAQNLQPNTYYKLRIKPQCGTDMTANFRQAIFATSDNWCGGANLYDSGGATGNYHDNQDVVRVILPNQPNSKVKIQFTAFDTEANYDKLWIYDGSNTNATVLGNANGFSGTTNPGTFVSTAENGALTIRFAADGGTNRPGYTAAVSCQTVLGTSDNTAIDFSYYPNPATNVVNIKSQNMMSEVEVYNVYGQLLHKGKLSGMEAQVDVSSYSSGTYFFKLKFDSAEANFKIVKQ